MRRLSILPGVVETALEATVSVQAKLPAGAPGVPSKMRCKESPGINMSLGRFPTLEDLRADQAMVGVIAAHSHDCLSAHENANKVDVRRQTVSGPIGKPLPRYRTTRAMSMSPCVHPDLPATKPPLTRRARRATEIEQCV